MRGERRGKKGEWRSWKDEGGRMMMTWTALLFSLHPLSLILHPFASSLLSPCVVQNYLKMPGNLLGSPPCQCANGIGMARRVRPGMLPWLEPWPVIGFLYSFFAIGLQEVCSWFALAVLQTNRKAICKAICFALGHSCKANCFAKWFALQQPRCACKSANQSV